MNQATNYKVLSLALLTAFLCLMAVQSNANEALVNEKLVKKGTTIAQLDTDEDITIEDTQPTNYPLSDEDEENMDTSSDD